VLFQCFSSALSVEFLLLDDVIEEGNDIDLKDKHIRGHKDGSVSAFSVTVAARPVIFQCFFSVDGEAYPEAQGRLGQCPCPLALVCTTKSFAGVYSG
jgi:hypothetical protein